MRWPLAFAAVLLFFALVYYLAPNVEQRNWKWVTPGSLLGSVLWLALSGPVRPLHELLGLVRQDLRLAGRRDRAPALALLLGVAVLFGAELNAELDRQADIRAAGGPRAGLVTPARRTSS